MVWQSNLQDLHLQFTTRDLGSDLYGRMQNIQEPWRIPENLHTTIMGLVFQSEGEPFKLFLLVDTPVAMAFLQAAA
jgi:hypothetical protein